ncbi:MAG: hypothetical protein JWO86_4603 [Myxococcaceae bacterium]|jgi:hypothetical protein|nr:hypothetical protein [Myxococcaceae bacterium]MEA2749498.1 hypothetical protein [Myxococcales bacterium]
MSDAVAKDKATDVVLLGPPTADGGGVHVLRARDEKVETGELRALQEGRPITGEVVTLSPRKDNPRVCDVTDSYRPPTSAAAGHKGPANVATEAYRQGWDEVFGKKSSSVPPSAN